MSCCDKILKLCDVPVCSGIIETGIKAQVDGVHKLKVTYLNTEFVIEADLLVDDDVNFPADQLNENYTYTGKLYQPDGSPISIQKNSTTYNCISFKTMLSYTITG